MSTFNHAGAPGRAAALPKTYQPSPLDAFRAEVLLALGAAPDHIEPGKRQRFATSGRKGDTSGWCQLFEDGRAGVYGDWRSGLSAVWSATPREQLTPAQAQALRHQIAEAKAKRTQEQAQAWIKAGFANAKLWQQSQPIAANATGSDPVTTYLRRRLALADFEALALPACLRFHPALAYYHEGQCLGYFPAMVAAISGPAGGMVALHRTYLAPDGLKADVPGPVKKLTCASGPVMSGCIRLGWLTPSLAQRQHQALAGTSTLGIAEGIETALAARCGSGLPTVAAYSAAALAAWTWPHELRHLVIFADNDAPDTKGQCAGQDAATTLRERAQTAGLSASILLPTEAGQDFCDVWAKRASASAPRGTPCH